jgi:glycosyltransferase involved in cell wall biosynthesis
MPFGAPVVQSERGEAAAELSEAHAGLQEPPEDPVELAAAIRYLKDHPDQAAAMGQRGRAFVVHGYSRAEQARRLDTLLRAVVGR